MELQNFRLGTTDEPVICADAATSSEVAAAMVRQAGRYVDIFSKELNPLIYDTEACCEAVEALALSGRGARIRIIVRESRVIAQRGHCLLRLSQRLSSFIQFRRPAEEHMGLQEDFLIVDNIGLLHQPQADNPRAHANFCAPGEARRLGNLFQRVWDFGEPDPELRALIF